MTSLDRQRKHWEASFDAVEQEIFTLFHTRQIWKILRAVFLAGGTDDRAVAVSHIDRTYVAAVCSAIRRQLDTYQRSDSLTRSLLSLKSQPALMDRRRFVVLHDQGREPDPYFDANKAFNSYAKPGSDVVDSDLIDDAVEKLRVAAGPVERYADRVIAHRDRRSASLAFDQIDHSLDALEVTVKRFWGLVHPGVMLHSLTPVTDLSFLRMFQSPLIDETFIPPLQR